jgi:hypothetical protein
MRIMAVTVLVGSEKSLTPEKAMDLLLTAGADLTPIRVYLSELLKVSILGSSLQSVPSQTSGLVFVRSLMCCTLNKWQFNAHVCMYVCYAWAVKYGSRGSGGLVFEVGAAPGSAGKSQRTMICTWLCEIYLHQVLEFIRLLTRITFYLCTHTYKQPFDILAK